MLRSLNRIIKIRISDNCDCTFILYPSHFQGIEQKASPKFKVIAFYTAKNDKAHISFVHEANRWFAKWRPDTTSHTIQQITGII